MNTLAVVLSNRSSLRSAGWTSVQPAPKTSSSTSSGAASAPAPSACSGPAGCRPSPAWAIRWSPATSRSAAYVEPVRAPGGAVGERVFVPGARCFGEVRGLFGGAASRLVVPGAARGADRRATWASRACCWRWPRPPITRSPAAARSAGSDRRPRRARPAAGAACRRGRRRPPIVWERNPRRAGGARSATG